MLTKEQSTIYQRHNSQKEKDQVIIMNMAMIKKMQTDMMKAQQEIEASTFIGKAANGDITVAINGKKEVTKVTIAPALVDPEDVSFLEDLVMIAINDANKQADAKTEATMGKFTGGMKIPGLF